MAGRKRSSRPRIRRRATVAAPPPRDDEATPSPLQTADQLLAQGHAREAIPLYRQALALQPDIPEALNNLGGALKEQGNLAEAVVCLERASALLPGSHQILNNLGYALTLLGRLEEAVAILERGLVLEPESPELLNSLGYALLEQGRVEEAIARLEGSLACRPGNPQALINLGAALREWGALEEAAVRYREALALQPDNRVAHDNLLFLLGYFRLGTPEEILEEHRRWDRIHGKTGRENALTHPARRRPREKLRIGYVSPDFCNHAVRFFIEPIIKAHDRNRVSVHCYAEVLRPDDATERLKALADGWRETAGLDDRELAQAIHDDGIDILVDLAGHTAHNRLGAFTYKPAPIQATYLGYFATTGLAAMDYWITDRELHPDAGPEATVEEKYRLNRCWMSYQPRLDAPEAALAPRQEGAGVVFGSFNHLRKITPGVVEAWAAILQRVPNARLLIKSQPLADPGVRARFVREFTAQGIDAARLDLRAHTASYREHMALYGAMDIALDPFPCTGGTTSADALWMGIPVVTWAGESFIQRMSLSMVTAIGQPDWVAPDVAGYVDLAVRMAEQGVRRTEQRRALRQQVAASPFGDPEDLTRALEAAYFDMWGKTTGPA